MGEPDQVVRIHAVPAGEGSPYRQRNTAGRTGHGRQYQSFHFRIPRLEAPEENRRVFLLLIRIPATQKMERKYWIKSMSFHVFPLPGTYLTNPAKWAII